MKRERERTVTEAAPLSIDNIGDLDGGVFRFLANKEINAALSDLSDRGAEDGKARHVIIDIELIKSNGMNIATPRVIAKLPPRVSGSTIAKERMRTKDQTEWLFQAANAENPDQPTLEDTDPNQTEE